MKEERKIKLTVAYDGHRYHGFQRQLNGISVQEVLEERLKKIFGHPLSIIGASRTDAGVHAYGQVVHFRTTGSIPTERIPKATVGLLPDDIVIRTAEDVPDQFHARHDAKSKIYVYRLRMGRIKDPFLQWYAWQYPGELDGEKMNEAAQLILGEHDFSAFQASGSKIVDPVREILVAGCRQDGCQIEFFFHGTGFLYHMVRNLVGTLVKVGSGELSPKDVAIILAGRDRSKAGITAPPQGLYLREIFY